MESGTRHMVLHLYPGSPNAVDLITVLCRYLRDFNVVLEDGFPTALDAVCRSLRSQSTHTDS